MQRKWIRYTLGLVLAASGLTAVLLSRADAIASDAQAAQKIPFALGLIGILIGLMVIISGITPGKPVGIRTLTMSAMFAALCYVGFAFFQIKIPVGDSATSFHLGNVFCALAALCIGPVWGGLAGAVGMTIGDLLDPVYITSAPKTFLLKLGIGLITGFVAHRVFSLSQERSRKIPLPAATAISCAAGMAFNMVADPVVGYFYKMYIMGVPQDAAAILAKMSAVTTAVNAVIAIIAATVFYLALRPALRRSNLLPHL